MQLSSLEFINDLAPNLVEFLVHRMINYGNTLWKIRMELKWPSTIYFETNCKVSEEQGFIWGEDKFQHVKRIFEKSVSSCYFECNIIQKKIFDLGYRSGIAELQIWLRVIYRIKLHFVCSASAREGSKLCIRMFLEV